jgi:hypothetical protein
MPTALNPITLPEEIDKNIEPERFIQSAFQVWLEQYFTGIAFQTYDPHGAETSITFPIAIIKSQEAPLPESGDKPFIHLTFMEDKTNRMNYSPSNRGFDIQWAVSAMIKVPASLSTTGSQVSKSKYLLRKTADSFAWLISSHETSALQQISILDICHKDGPTILPQANGWISRLIIFTCKTRREIPRPL